MSKSQKLLVVLLLIFGMAAVGAAIEKRPAAGEASASSKELLEAAQSVYDIHSVLYQRSAGASPEDIYLWSKRVMTAERDLNPAAGEGTKAVQAHLERMQKLEEIAKARHQAARASGGDVAAAKYYRIEAELMLARMKE